MDPVDNQRATTSLSASIEANRALLKKYKNDQGRKTLTEQVENSRTTKHLPSSSLNNSKEVELEEDEMENAESNQDSKFRRHLEGLDEKDETVESAEVEVLLLRISKQHKIPPPCL